MRCGERYAAADFIRTGAADGVKDAIDRQLQGPGAAAKLESIVGESPNCSFDADLNGPPDGVPVHPAVTTRAQVLPFGELTWENFRAALLPVSRQGAGRRIRRAVRAIRSGSTGHRLVR